jgi:hypothetical protein
VFETASHTVEQMAEEAHRRYAEIMSDVERMIDDHSKGFLLFFLLSDSNLVLLYQKAPSIIKGDADLPQQPLSTKLYSKYIILRFYVLLSRSFLLLSAHSILSCTSKGRTSRSIQTQASRS